MGGIARNGVGGGGYRAQWLIDKEENNLIGATDQGMNERGGGSEVCNNFAPAAAVPK